MFLWPLGKVILCPDLTGGLGGGLLCGGCPSVSFTGLSLNSVVNKGKMFEQVEPQFY